MARLAALKSITCAVVVALVSACMSLLLQGLRVRRLGRLALSWLSLLVPHSLAVGAAGRREARRHSSGSAAPAFSRAMYLACRAARSSMAPRYAGTQL